MQSARFRAIWFIQPSLVAPIQQSSFNRTITPCAILFGESNNQVGDAGCNGFNDTAILFHSSQRSTLSPNWSVGDRLTVLGRRAPISFDVARLFVTDIRFGR